MKDDNRTLPVFVIRDEFSRQKIPLSGSTFSVVCNMFTHTNNEILFEDLLDFIEAVLLDRPIEVSPETLPSLRYDDRCQTAPRIGLSKVFDFLEPIFEICRIVKFQYRVFSSDRSNYQYLDQQHQKATKMQ